MHNVGGGDYHVIGRAFADKIAARTQLQSEWSVLDIGCGTGRVAAPLLSKLDANGSYTGFDVSQRAVAWAQRHVTPGLSTARFVHVDAANSEYNPKGKQPGSAISFPADDASVDLCFATSLFTHLCANDARHYLAESARVLKPGHKLFLTAFLIDPLAALSGTVAPRLEFQAINDRSYTTDLKTPEHAMAFDQAAFISWARQVGLRPVGMIERGSWSGRPSHTGFQDEIIFEKRKA